ncbi:MAG TPA: hypothetical protein V6C81_29510 [Planktothrix sp.]|jgi:hypothetical protein
MFTNCVLREVAPSDVQYVPIGEVPFIADSETIYSGNFRSLREKLGPYRSHERTICLPEGKLRANTPALRRGRIPQN